MRGQDAWHSLLDRLEALSAIKAGPGIKVRHDKGAGPPVISAVGRKPLAPRLRRFEPHALRDDQGTWKLKVAPGFILDTHVRNEEPTGGVPGTPQESAAKVRVPRIDVSGTWEPISRSHLTGSLYHSWAPPELELPGLVSYIYVRFRTDSHGNILEAYGSTDPNDDRPIEIVVSATELDSIHHEPPNAGGSNGIEGDYYFQIAKTISNEETVPAPIVIHEGVQNDVLWQEAFVAESISSGANVYKRFNNLSDTLEFRGVKARYGIIHDEGVFDVVLDADPHNHGGGVGVWAEPDDPVDGGKLDFRTIDGGDSPRNEIQVEIDPSGADEDDISDPRVFKKILVRGNNNFGNLIFEDCDGGEVGRLTWADGLITSSGDTTLVLGDCTTTTST